MNRHATHLHVNGWLASNKGHGRWNAAAGGVIAFRVCGLELVLALRAAADGWTLSCAKRGCELHAELKAPC